MTTMTEEKKEAVKDISFIPVVKNDVDDPNILSLTTVNSLPEKADDEKVAKTKEDETTPSSEEVKAEEKADKETEEKKAVSRTEEKEKEIIEKPKEIDPVQRRINEITKKRRVAERELDFERKKRIEAEQELERIKTAVPDTDKPKIEDYATEAEYYEALTDWKIDNKLKIDREKNNRESLAKKEKEDVVAVYDAIESKIEKGNEKYADFNEVVLAEDLKITEQMLEVVNVSDMAEDILYYLGKNPDISADIAKMNPVLMTREIVRIEAKLVAPPSHKKITKAPDPIQPIKTTGVIDKDPSNMTPKEYRAWRERNKP